MKGHLKIRNGFFSKDREFFYYTGYVTNVNGTHRTSAHYDKQTNDVKVKNHYTTEIDMVDIDHNEERGIFLPYNINAKRGDFITLIYVKSDEKGKIEPIAIYNHENDVCNFDPKEKHYIGFKLLGYGKMKRFLACLVRVPEYIIAFFLTAAVIAAITGKLDGTAYFIALFLCHPTWFLVGFFSNLFFPSFFGAKRAFSKFDSDILDFCRKELPRTREIRKRMATAQNPMNNMPQPQMVSGIGPDPSMVSGIGPDPSRQVPPQGNNGGYQSMF